MFPPPELPVRPEPATRRKTFPYAGEFSETLNTWTQLPPVGRCVPIKPDVRLPRSGWNVNYQHAV